MAQWICVENGSTLSLSWNDHVFLPEEAVPETTFLRAVFIDLTQCQDKNYEPSRIVSTDPVAEQLLVKVILKSNIFRYPQDYILGRDTFYVESFNNVFSKFRCFLFVNFFPSLTSRSSWVSLIRYWGEVTIYILITLQNCQIGTCVSTREKNLQTENI
jgi:hypothetical protein